MITWPSLFTVGCHIPDYLQLTNWGFFGHNHGEVKYLRWQSLLHIFLRQAATSSFDHNVIYSAPWEKRETEHSILDECSLCTTRNLAKPAKVDSPWSIFWTITKHWVIPPNPRDIVLSLVIENIQGMDIVSTHTPFLVVIQQPSALQHNWCDFSTSAKYHVDATSTSFQPTQLEQ